MMFLLRSKFLITYEVVIYVYYQDQLLYQTKDWFHYD